MHGFPSSCTTYTNLFSHVFSDISWKAIIPKGSQYPKGGHAPNSCVFGGLEEREHESRFVDFFMLMMMFLVSHISSSEGKHKKESPEIIEQQKWETCGNHSVKPRPSTNQRSHNKK